MGSSSSAEATRARRGRETGRESAPVPKPPRSRWGCGTPGTIARGAAARWCIAGGILSASGLLIAPRATPGSVLRSKTQPTTFPASRKPPAHYAHAERYVAANARFSPQCTPDRPMPGSNCGSRPGSEGGLRQLSRTADLAIPGQPAQSAGIGAADFPSSRALTTRASFSRSAPWANRTPESIRFDTIRNVVRVRVTTAYASLALGVTRATPKLSSLAAIRNAPVRSFSPPSSSCRFVFSRSAPHLGVGKMGVKFSGTDHLSLGRYWYTPTAMCERRRCGWFI